MTLFSLQEYQGIDNRRNDWNARSLTSFPRSLGSIVENPRDDDAEMRLSECFRSNP
jgi:hypothetical protein